MANDKYVVCKCGGDMRENAAGDETYWGCPDCGRISHEQNPITEG